jgi:hypothetical protein
MRIELFLHVLRLPWRTLNLNMWKGASAFGMVSMERLDAPEAL